MVFGHPTSDSVYEAIYRGVGPGISYNITWIPSLTLPSRALGHLLMGAVRATGGGVDLLGLVLGGVVGAGRPYARDVVEPAMCFACPGFVPSLSESKGMCCQGRSRSGKQFFKRHISRVAILLG